MRPVIKNYHSGRVPSDGNSMTGGDWWGCEHLGYKDVEWDDIADAVENMCEHIPNFRLEAYFHVGEDKSTGTHFFCDLDERFDPEGVDEAIDKAPISDLWKKALKAVVGAYCEDVKDEDYNLYE